MKKTLNTLIIGAMLFLATTANAISFSWIESKVSGKSKTSPSIWREVDAAGWDFRQYTWEDPAGRICTIVFTDEKGGALDCDFPPNWNQKKGN